MSWFTFGEATSKRVFLKKINPLEIILTYRNSQLCFEVVNIPPRKDIAYKRTRAFTLNLRNLVICELKTVHGKIYHETNCFISWRCGGHKITGCMTFVWTFVEEYWLFHTRKFFQSCVGKRETIQERSVHLMCKCRHSTT